MGKQPAFQFYPNDWLRDTQPLTLQAKGAWIHILSHMWFATERGKLTFSLDGYSRLLGTNLDETISVLQELIDLRICDTDVTFLLHVTERNKNVTLINRRMVNDEKERKSTAYRVAKYRERRSNATVTTYLQSSSSSSSSKKEIYKERKSKRGTQFPEDFSVSPRIIELAKKHQWPDPSKEIDAFRDYHTAKGSAFKDWEAAFRTWLRNGKTFGNGAEPIYPYETLYDCGTCKDPGYHKMGEVCPNGPGKAT